LLNLSGFVDYIFKNLIMPRKRLKPPPEFFKSPTPTSQSSAEEEEQESRTNPRQNFVCHLCNTNASVLGFKCKACVEYFHLKCVHVNDHDETNLTINAALLKQELYCNSCKPNYTNKLLVSSVEYSQTSSPANEQWKMIKNFMTNIEKRLNDLEKNPSLAPVLSVRPAAIISPSMPPTYAQQVITNTRLNRSNHQDSN
ncbi:unnamed protein product, partial [Didymodactylos carnosus]